MTAGYLAKLKAEMEDRLGCKIEIVEDADSRYPCKIEYARNYARQSHILRVNPQRCLNAYPIFFVLLNTKLQLRESSSGTVGVLQPVSFAEENARFHADFISDPKGKMLVVHMGTQADSVESTLRASLITQACNQVLEMLAADVTLRDYPDAVEDMKQYLAAAAVEGASVSYKELLKTYPAFLVNCNRILNLVFSMKCGEVCGKKLVNVYNPSPDEVDRALDIYNFYRIERDSLLEKGRIEGDLLEKILRKLKLDRYVHLEVHEIAPFSIEPSEEGVGDGLTDEQRTSLEEFYENYGDGKSDSGLMVLGMYKVLLEVRKMPLEVVRSIAMEIALLGASGISPQKKYNLKTMPNRPGMMGLEVLAYCYVSWAKVFPDKIDLLGLPYKTAYERAVAMMHQQSEH